jgi:hypothetical protein
MLIYFALVVGMWVAHGQAQTSKYPPIEQYLMPQADEIALVRTAAPANISERATIKVLTNACWLCMSPVCGFLSYQHHGGGYLGRAAIRQKVEAF